MEMSTKEQAQMVRIMKGLQCSAKEAREILMVDKAIDKGANPFPLTAEQEKASKDARQADRKPTVYKLDNTNGKRSKKVDEDKRFLMFLIQNAIEQSPNTADFELTNVERECVFHYNGKKYKIVLSAPRS